MTVLRRLTVLRNHLVKHYAIADQWRVKATVEGEDGDEIACMIIHADKHGEYYHGDSSGAKTSTDPQERAWIEICALLKKPKEKSVPSSGALTILNRFGKAELLKRLERAIAIKQEFSVSRAKKSTLAKKTTVKKTRELVEV